MKNIILFVLALLGWINTTKITAQSPTLLKDIVKGDEGILPSTLIGKIDSFAYFTVNMYGKKMSLWEFNTQTKAFKFIAFTNTVFLESKTVFFNQIIGNERWISKYQPNLSVTQLMKINNGESLLGVFDENILITNGGALFNVDVKEQKSNLLAAIVPEKIVKLNNNLILFTKNNEIWKTDGTPKNTTIVKKLVGTLNNTKYYVWNNEIFFYLSSQIWKSNGTAQGTIAISPTSANLYSYDELMFTNKAFYFVSNDNGIRKIWKSNGTKNGTKLCKFPDFSQVLLSNYFVYNNQLLVKTVVASGDMMNVEILSEQADTAYVIVKSNYPIKNFKNTYTYFNIQDTLYFGISASDSAMAMIKTNIANATVEPVTIPLPTINRYSGNVTLGKYAFFSAANRYKNFELWRTDGTPQGTIQLGEISPGLRGSNPKAFFAFDDFMLFIADDGKYGPEFWRTDGKNTVFVENLNTSSKSNYNNYTSGLFKLKDKFCFTVDDRENGNELWVSDGTTQGTMLLKNFSSNSASSTFTNYIVLDEKLYFNVLSDSTNNIYQLWVTDGTIRGTKPIIDTIPYRYSFGKQAVAKLNNELYYKADRGTSLFYAKITLDSNALKASIVIDNIKSIAFEFYTPQQSLIIGEVKDSNLIVHVINKFGVRNSLTFDNFFRPNIDFTDAFLSDNYIVFQTYDTKQGQDAFEYINLQNKEISSIPVDLWSPPLLHEGALYFTTFANNAINFAKLQISNKKLEIISNSKFEEKPEIINFINERIFYIDIGGFSTFDLKTKESTRIFSAWNILGLIPHYILNGQLFFTDFGNIVQTDGTLKGTKLISSTPLAIEHNIISLGEDLFFIAADDTYGFEIWKYNTKTNHSDDIVNVNAPAITLYPIPSHDLINIDATIDIQTAEIFDIQGKKRFSTVVNAKSFSLPTNTLENGSYILHFMGQNNQSVLKKMIIQH